MQRMYIVNGSTFGLFSSRSIVSSLYIIIYLMLCMQSHVYLDKVMCRALDFIVKDSKYGHGIRIIFRC